MPPRGKNCIRRNQRMAIYSPCKFLYTYSCKLGIYKANFTRNLNLLIHFPTISSSLGKKKVNKAS